MIREIQSEGHSKTKKQNKLVWNLQRCQCYDRQEKHPNQIYEVIRHTSTQYTHTQCIGSDQISRSVMSDSLRPHESQHARPPCPSPTPGVHSDSRPSSWWCHPVISSSVIPFSSCPQSLPASESFPMSQLFAWGGQSTGVQLQHHSFQRNPRNDLLQNGLVGSPCSPRDSQESSPTPHFKSINSSALSLLHSPTHIHTWPQGKP